jgi:hypothetical protein
MRKNLLSTGFFVVTALLTMLSACGDPETIYAPTPLTPAGAEVTIELLASDNPDRDVRVMFSPGADAVKYKFAIGTTEDLDNFKEGRLDSETVEGVEATEHVFASLESGATYMLFARAYLEDGTEGPVSSLIAHTSIIVIEPDFIGSESMAWKIAPSLGYRAIEYSLSTSLDNPDDVILSYGKDDLVAPWTATFFDLTPETTYYLSVKAQDRYGVWTEDIVTEVTTKSFEEVPGLTVTSNIHDFWIEELTFTPNSQTSFFAFYFTEGGVMGPESYQILAYNGDYKQYLIDNVINFQGAILYDAETTQQYVNAYQALGVPYDLYVMLFGPDDSEPSIVTRVSWTTPDYDESAGVAEVGVTVEPTTSGAIYTWAPNDDTVGFYYETFTTQWIADNVSMTGMQEEDMIRDWFTNMSQSLFETQWNYRYLPDWFWEPTWTDESGAELPSGTELAIYVMPLNKNGLFDGVGKLTKVTYNKL